MVRKCIVDWQFPINNLITDSSEIQRLENGGDNFESESCGFREPIKYFDIYRERPVRLTVRALVPVKEHPKVNTDTQSTRTCSIICFAYLGE